MEFTVERKAILAEAELALGAAEAKLTIPILANFRLKAQGGKVELTATDLELAMTLRFAADVKADGTATVPARRLTEILKALPDGEVKIKELENHWLQVKSGKAKFKLPGISAESFPVVPEPPKSDVRLPAIALGEAIRKTSFAISKEESRYTLNGALLLVGADGFKLVATDGHRLAAVDSKFEIPGTKDIRILVPQKALGVLANLIGKAKDDAVVEFAQNFNHLFFTLGSRILVSRLMTGQFPNYEAVLPKDNTRIATVDAGLLARAISRVGLLADERMHAIKLTVSPGKISVAAASGDFGEAHDDLDATYDGEPLTIGFNFRYLLDFLGVVAGPIEIRLKDESTAAEMAPVGSEYRYVVMPMRV